MREMALGAMLLWTAGAAAAPTLFSSRVAYRPLVDKLAKSGGSPDKIVHVARAADLGPLAAGRRYKFALDEAGRLTVAPLPADAPHNEYVHPILAGGKPVRTAGGITVERDARGAVTAVVLDEDSASYCPSFASLDAAAEALVAAGVPAAAVRKVDQKPTCAPPAQR